jgi:glycosyltransferase involved in cell wall biosynthesis
VLTSSFGGPAIQVVECSLAALDHGVTSSIVSTDLAGPPSRQRRLVSSEAELPSGVQQIEVSLCRSSWPYRFAYSRELKPVLERELAQADLLRIHSLFLFPQYAAYREAVRADVPYIVTFHGALDPYLRRRGRLRKWITDVVWQADMLKHAAAIHVSSRYEQMRTADVVPDVPRVLVPNGISWHRFQDLPDGDEFRAARLDGHEGPVVLSLGRIARAKAPERLVRALPEVTACHPRTLLVFAGPDHEDLARGLRALARSLGVESSVRFVGMLRGDERLGALSAADVWALPSHTDSFAVAAAEAMAAGLPVVLTPQVKIASEAASAGAAIVTRADAADLGEQLVRLLDDLSLRQRLGARAREHAKQYDWGRVGLEFVRIYRDVVATSGRQGQGAAA